MYKRILVPLDGSKLAEQALSHVVIQAGQFEAEIALLMVLGLLPDSAMAGLRVVQSAEETSARLAQTYLEGVAPRLRE
jgi:nucleotide-binding universal stress UspA family protein